MSITEGWAYIYPNGEFHRLGVDHFRSVVIKRKDNTIVVKQDGGSYWSGIGQRGRAGAEFQIWSILEHMNDPATDSEKVRVKLLVDFPVRQPKVGDQLTSS